MNLFDLVDARNKTALTYPNHDVIQQEVEARLIDKLQFIRYEPNSILELGCSSGRFAKQLVQHYPKLKQYVGYDIAEQRLPADTIGCRFLKQDAPGHIPLAHSPVDLVIANLYWHWVEDMGALLTDIFQILSPGGLLIFSVFGTETLRELKQAWQAVDNQTHVQNFDDTHDLGDAVLRTGFADPVLYNETITIEYQQLSTLFDDIKGQGAGYYGQDRMKHLMSKGRYQKLLSAYSRQSSHYPASFEIIYGQAWKAKPSDKAAIDQSGEVSIRIDAIQKN